MNEVKRTHNPLTIIALWVHSLHITMGIIKGGHPGWKIELVMLPLILLFLPVLVLIDVIFGVPEVDRG